MVFSIAGMSDVVIVIEAKQPGGAMHQIEYALKRNRPVYIWKPRASRKDLILGYKSFIRKGAQSFQTMEELKERIHAYFHALGEFWRPFVLNINTLGIHEYLTI